MGVTTRIDAPSPLPASAISRLRAEVRGPVLAPGDPGYDEARRVWNGAIDRRPAVIVRCADADDVAAAVRLSGAYGVATAVRGGGHSVAGTSVCDGGIVVDLSHLTAVRVDPASRRARAQGGVLWGALDRASQNHGLAVTGGIVSHTGIAGLTLGGGIGWLMRRHGLAADNLVSAEVVGADGTRRIASEAADPDLLWALRGGGGNFGVVTSFEYQLHPIGPHVLAGPIFFPLEAAPTVLAFYRDWVASAPVELTTILNFRRAPAVSFLPTEMHGRPIVAVTVCFVGSIPDGERVLRPLRRFVTPLIDLIRPKPYLDHQMMFDPLVPHGWHYYWKSCNVAALSDQVINPVIDRTANITSPRSYTLIFQLGGAVATIGEDDTAYSHRGAGFAVNINAAWTPDEVSGARHVRWTRELYRAVEPTADGVYMNFLGDEGDDRVRAAYGTATFDRLRGLKDRYDPHNLFRSNQNITPTKAWT
jgi:FAD/FMN-containing dehydrogenase